MQTFCTGYCNFEYLSIFIAEFFYKHIFHACAFLSKYVPANNAASNCTSKKKLAGIPPFAMIPILFGIKNGRFETSPIVVITNAGDNYNSHLLSVPGDI